MSKVVAITLCRRIEQTQRLLAALERCHDAASYHFEISCDIDPRHAGMGRRVWEIARDWAAQPGRSAQVHFHEPRLGIDLNKIWLLNRCFSLSDYVTLLEDDTMPAPDALLFFEQVGKRLRDDTSVFSICGYNRIADPVQQAFAAADPFAIATKRGFCPWGWATWRNRWDPFFADGGSRYCAEVDSPNGRFDWWLDSGREHRMAYPILSRIESVSAPLSEHTPSEEWHQEHEANPFGAWSVPGLPIPTLNDWS